MMRRDMKSQRTTLGVFRCLDVCANIYLRMLFLQERKASAWITCLRDWHTQHYPTTDSEFCYIQTL